MDPAAMLRFAWEAAEVFSARSLELAQNPAEAGFRLSDMALEKQRAFTEGLVAAWDAALLGTRADLVAKAAMAPAQRQVTANHRGLDLAPLP